MPCTSKNVVRTWVFITILTLTVVNVIGSEEKRLDLKIGFDLTQGDNGAPSLRIRDFEESSEAKPRAEPKEAAETKESKPDGHQARADSFSDSDDNMKKPNRQSKETKVSKESKESAKSEDEDEDDDSSGEAKLSTRGLKPGDYEPEENARIHGKYTPSEDDGEDSDKTSRRRRKRHAFLKGNYYQKQ